jgi:hypothetical protein
MMEAYQRARRATTMIPELVDNVLPEGVHDCTLDEVAERFGHYGRTGQRFRLVQSLRAFIEAAARTGMVAALVIDGSFVTAKDDPGDIDLIVVLKPGTDLTQPLRPFEYNVLIKPGVRRTYGHDLDVFVAEDGSDGYFRNVDFLSRVRVDDPGQQTSRTRKGVLRVAL